MDRPQPNLLDSQPMAPGLRTDAMLVGSPAQVHELYFPKLAPLSGLNLPGETMVLGAVRKGEAKAYPVSVMWIHHVVNDTLGGLPFLATFCGNCFSGVGFDPTNGGRHLTFRLGGAYEGAFLLRDDQTSTLWAQMTGEALLGPMVGSTLRLQPLYMVTVESWLEAHPDSLALEVTEEVAPYNPSPGRRSIGGRWKATVSHWDSRAHPQALVLGVATRGHVRGYLLDPTQRGPRLHEDRLGDIPIVLMAYPGAWPLAYERRVDGAEIDFRLVEGRPVDETGSEWDGSGNAVNGQRAGASLRPLVSHLAEWYAWAAHYPQSELVDLSGAE